MGRAALGASPRSTALADGDCGSERRPWLYFYYFYLNVYTNIRVDWEGGGCFYVTGIEIEIKKERELEKE